MPQPGKDWLLYGALLTLGAALYLVCALYPAYLPFFLPWEFSWPIYLATSLTLAWFVRGLRILPKVLPPAEQPALWRKISFVAGIASFYIVLQTHVDYYAQHMFFVHRWAHFVLHHFGAFFIALGMSGPVLWAGMPDFLKAPLASRPVQGTLAFLQHPVMAPIQIIG
jgi:putative membrane protein